MTPDQLAELVQELIEKNEMTADVVQAIALLECAKHLAIISECCSKNKGWQPRKERKNVEGVSPIKQGIHMTPKKQP